MLILNSILSNNSSDMIDFVLPPKYKTLKNELNKNKKIENIYSGEKFIKEVLGEIMNNKYETSMDKIDEKVSIVIKSCNIKNLEVCMENINKNTDEDYEITIISTEAEYLKKNYSEYNIILLSDNIAESYNQAINKCNSDWIVFLDDDKRVTECAGFAVKGTTENIEEYLSWDFIVAIGDALARQNVFKKLENIQCNIVSLIHPKAVVSRRVEIKIYNEFSIQ